MITRFRNRTEFRECVGIRIGACIAGTDTCNSGIVLEVINGIAGIRWNWFRNVQHRGIGCILNNDFPERLRNKFIMSNSELSLNFEISHGEFYYCEWNNFLREKCESVRL